TERRATAADALEDPSDAEAHPADVDVATDRILDAEQLFRGRLPEHDGPAAGRHVGRGDALTTSDLATDDLRVAGGHPERGRVDPLALRLQAQGADGVAGRTRLAAGQFTVDAFDVVDAEATTGRPRLEVAVARQHEQQVGPEA